MNGFVSLMSFPVFSFKKEMEKTVVPALKKKDCMQASHMPHFHSIQNKLLPSDTVGGLLEEGLLDQPEHNCGM